MAIYQNGRAVERLHHDGAEVKRAYSGGEIVFDTGYAGGGLVLHYDGIEDRKSTRLNSSH